MLSKEEHLNWILNDYPAYWSRASKRYGLDAYGEGLLQLIAHCAPRSAFELAIGTGYPFAETLHKQGITVSGCDISQHLIDELKKANPGIQAFAGSYGSKEAGEGPQVDLVYCLRSSWYFPEFLAAIDFMIAKAKPGGTVIFDIMNAESACNKAIVANKNLRFPVTIAKNFIKKLLNLLNGDRRYMTDTVFGVREIMYRRTSIDAFLREKKLAYQALTIGQVLGSPSTEGQYADDQKIVFVIRKD